MTGNDGTVTQGVPVRLLVTPTRFVIDDVHQFTSWARETSRLRKVRTTSLAS